MKKVAQFFVVISWLKVVTTEGKNDAISLAMSMRDGETIVSSGGSFEMGFFSPGRSKNRYIGVWYANIPEKNVVWVANRDTPIISTSGVLKVENTGMVILLNDTNKVLWSTNVSRMLNDPVLQLLDSGNLVLREENGNNTDEFVWESFDYLSDTLLPGMKLGRDFVTGLERYLSSWKSEDDPAPGDFTFHCDPSGYPHNVLRKGSLVLYHTGPWNGVSFNGASTLKKNTIYKFDLVLNEKEVYYTYQMIGQQVISRLTLSSAGSLQRWTWTDRNKGWASYLSVPSNNNCDRYSKCGAYGSCDSNNSPACGCLDKFKPKNQSEWDRADWSSGCTRGTSLDCKSDGFVKRSGVKFPDARYSSYNRSISLKECAKLCMTKCSCMAYASLDIRDGRGCVRWLGDLVDIEVLPQDNQEIYVRMASSDLSTPKKEGHGTNLIVLLVVVIALLLCLSLALYAWIRKKDLLLKKEEEKQRRRNEENYITKSHTEDLDFPIFSLVAIANATSNFSIQNKLGEGGFGPVYKGLTEDGQEIAVKRLSVTSGQGVDEFKNEVICISKLQHRNLVRLLGCCIQGIERMLIYEYMPNKSLDYFIFDETRSILLDWPKRYDIINGIARGLQYLHQDSRLRIIHRDLKASNILLDNNMNPKISDFGIARSFVGDEMEADTKRVVGTYGYMSPEYAIDGIFSVKSDVFSFGVLVLEILSGKRNRGFTCHDHHHNLLGHAWILLNEGKIKELTDPTLGDSLHLPEVLRSIHVGLLCVQQHPEDRPSMSTVVVMLSSKGELPLPKQPGFYTERRFPHTDFSSSTQPQSSTYEDTITQLEAR